MYCECCNGVIQKMRTFDCQGFPVVASSQHYSCPVTHIRIVERWWKRCQKCCDNCPLFSIGCQKEMLFPPHFYIKTGTENPKYLSLCHLKTFLALPPAAHLQPVIQLKIVGGRYLLSVAHAFQNLKKKLLNQIFQKC